MSSVLYQVLTSIDFFNFFFINIFALISFHILYCVGLGYMRCSAGYRANSRVILTPVDIGSSLVVEVLTAEFFPSGSNIASPSNSDSRPRKGSQ